MGAQDFLSQLAALFESTRGSPVNFELLQLLIHDPRMRNVWNELYRRKTVDREREYPIYADFRLLGHILDLREAPPPPITRRAAEEKRRHYQEGVARR
jgi:hypothetical protein